MTPAARAVVEAARALVRNRRWYLGLPEDRELPDTLQAAVDQAVRALDAAEADCARG